MKYKIAKIHCLKLTERGDDIILRQQVKLQQLNNSNPIAHVLLLSISSLYYNNFYRYNLPYII